jgi:hypothetical protein
MFSNPTVDKFAAKTVQATGAILAFAGFVKGVLGLGALFGLIGAMGFAFAFIAWEFASSQRVLASSAFASVPQEWQWAVVVWGGAIPSVIVLALPIPWHA